MDHFTYERVTHNVIKIEDNIGAQSVYALLIEGNERSVLLDTGFGLGNIRKLAESLTDKPISVYLTHAHDDHTAGVGWWDEAYLNEDDMHLFHSGERRERVEMIERMGGRTGVREDMVAPKFTGKLIPYKDGDVIDLGGTTLEVVEVPGHTPGCSMFLMKEDRIMIYGDAVGRKSGLWSDGTASQLVKALEHLREYDDQYDRIFRLHHGLEWPKGFADDVLECAKKIVNHTDAHQRVSFGPFDEVYSAALVDENDPELSRIDGKIGNVLYLQKNAR